MIAARHDRWTARAWAKQAAAALIKDSDLVVIEGGPHAIPWTHTDQVNTALLKFLGH
jgi:non-heme chloroperoxidase